MLFALILNTFREAVRNKVLYSVLLFVVVLVAVSALFGAVTIGSQVKVIKDFGLFALSFFGTIACIATGVNLLNKELKQKTIYNILSKSVPRWKFLLGKLLGLYLTTAVLVSLAGLLFIGFTAAFEGQVDPLLFHGLYLTLLEVLIVTGVTIFFSSLVITTSLAGIFTIATYIAGRSIGYLSYFMTPVGGEAPDPVSRAITQALDFILPDLSIFNVGNALVYGVPVTPMYALMATAYALAYTAVLFIASALIFNRRELN